LKLAGLFVSDGTLGFRKGNVKDGRVTQTPNGKLEFYEAANSLGLTRYDYKKESVWRIKRPLAEQLYEDFGHGSLKKSLPPWCFKLSYRQAQLFFHHLWLGDGTETTHGDCYYTGSKQLADTLQAMMIATGHICSVRGPYTCEGTFGPSIQYQVYVSNENRFRCVDFKKHLPADQVPKKKDGWPIKEQRVTDRRVVCFEVPNGTLITRNQGCVAIQGNCKFAYHVVRLLDEVEQILTEGDLDIRRNKAQLKAIRRGEVPEEEIHRWASEKEKALEKAYEDSKLPYGPNQEAIKTLLLECLEEHWGSVEGCVVTEERIVQALRDIADVIDVNRKLLG
jgi:hypothetical protein